MKNMKNKISAIILSTLIIGAISFSFKPHGEKRIVVIDAGHGGKDNGSAHENIYEKTIVESIAKKIKALNKDEHVEIILTRTNDDFIELKDRIEKVNTQKASLLISLHVNWSPNAETNGLMAFVSKENSEYEKSNALANKLIEALTSEHLAKGEVKPVKFEILSKTNCPAVSIEIGYISNEKNRKYLLTEEAQNDIAKKILANLIIK